MRAHEEVNIKDKSVYFLKRVIDVTDEVEELKKELTAQGIPTGIRKLSYLMENEYKTAPDTHQVRSVWSSFTMILHGMPC